MKHYLNLDRITVEFAERNKGKFVSCHFIFATGTAAAPTTNFYKECLKNGILEEFNLPCLDHDNAAKILKILWYSAGDMKFCGIENSRTELCERKLIWKNGWSTRGGYADGNFNEVHRTDYFYAA